ncbi:MAG: hypothetical protein NC039_08205 [Muribaculaceae bacterium]|nr:hypothetical protein [Muribaculaceae bacterium]
MKYPGFLPIVAASLLAASCSGSGIIGADTDDRGEEAGIFETTDLSLLELRHRVKRVVKTTYWKATPGVDSVVVDTTAANVTVTVCYFDSLGNYVARRDERIRRDEYGRIIRWEDRRPNLNRQHGGFLKDTLSYEHLSPNVVRTNGMGDFAVTVYDDERRIVGQYTDPVIDGEHTAVFNIYRDEDSRGNWTERLSVWTTQQPDVRPHISYTLEKREIVYY